MTAAPRPDPAESIARLTETQGDGCGDMDPETFRAAGHAVVDLIADYLAAVEGYPVLPPVEPGTIAPRFPAAAPETPEPLAAILADYRRLVEPNATHWQHPGFFAYFPTTASGPGILGEFLTAGLGQNPMLWRTSPIGTELEVVVVGWLRRALGLPDDFDGFLTDTASTSSLIALAAAREAVGIEAAALGLDGRAGMGRVDADRAGSGQGDDDGVAPFGDLRVYASAEAHSSIDKAAMTLGLGRASVVRVPVDDAFRLRVDALRAAIAADRAAGRRPLAIVATLGTTSSTSVDPVAELADVAAEQGLWLHVDAAYAGAAALVPEYRSAFAGWERADSIVVNPHKWWFTPLDASLLLTRRMADLRAAFSLVPEYLRTLDRAAPVRDVSEYTPQLGRRFRALKLWVQLRWFGLDGLRRRIRHHVELARRFAEWVDADPDWERLAPVPFSTVCFRWRPADRSETEASAADLDAANERILAAVNASGEVFLSHTRLDGRFTLRLAVGNLRTEARHVERAWALLREAAAAVGEGR
ncbi:MAG TPA: pyridoxal-dependent decarboxylase [Candidatus Binatia bacterium]|nr:pyridoxal-dependent decarboxylase [Candidatus Binatia bacterium]